MAVDWRLRQVSEAQDIRNAAQLQEALVAKMGIRLSRTALDKLLKRQPVQIRLETAQYLCTLLEVPLEGLLVITPEPIICQPTPIQPFGRKEHPAEALMVDPSRFF